MKPIIILSAALAFVLGSAGAGFSDHAAKDMTGTVTKIEVTEVELTVKDDKGKETKVKAKDPAAFKAGDRVVVKDGKVIKEVKPITGGY